MRAITPIPLLYMHMKPMSHWNIEYFVYEVCAVASTTDSTLQSEYSYLLCWMDDVDVYDYDNTHAHIAQRHTDTHTIKTIPQTSIFVIRCLACGS